MYLGLYFQKKIYAFAIQESPNAIRDEIDDVYTITFRSVFLALCINFYVNSFELIS
jgi:hypothetical protein